MLMVPPGKTAGYLLVILIVVTGMVQLFFLNESDSLYSRTEFFMNTEVTVKIKGTEEKKEVIAQTFAEMKEWAERLNRFHNDSIITHINNAEGQPVTVNSEMMRLLIKSKEYYKITEHAFDPTVAPLIDLWGFSGQKQRVPSTDELDKIIHRINFAKVKLDPASGEVSLPETTALEPGGMAKGFIVDKGSEFLQKNGITDFYINAGGNIRVNGEKSPGRYWRVGIKKPRKQNEIFENYIVEMSRGSLATSGDYQRYFIEDGIRYFHLLDPATGFPVREMQSVTIYAPTALEADIMSTAVFIKGWQQGRELIRELDHIEGFMVKNEKEIWYSPGFQDLM